MTPETVADGNHRVRVQAPLVHNVTNLVAATFSANVLIAAGASPIMAEAPEEAGELAAGCGALVVNMGTLNAAWLAGAEAAVRGAKGSARPWLLDPVGAGATRYRRDTGARLLDLGPTVVRGNASEVLALAEAGVGGKGVDSTQGADAAAPGARRLARDRGCTVVVTGAVDLVTDGERVVRVANGDPMLTGITASGCALSALTGAWLAVTPDPLEACVGALVCFGIAAELAAASARGPGSFTAGLLDALATLDRATILARARLV